MNRFEPYLHPHTWMYKQLHAWHSFHLWLQHVVKLSCLVMHVQLNQQYIHKRFDIKEKNQNLWMKTATHDACRAMTFTIKLKAEMGWKAWRKTLCAIDRRIAAPPISVREKMECAISFSNMVVVHPEGLSAVNPIVVNLCFLEGHPVFIRFCLACAYKRCELS